MRRHRLFVGGKFCARLIGGRGKMVKPISLRNLNWFHKKINCKRMHVALMSLSCLLMSLECHAYNIL